MARTETTPDTKHASISMPAAVDAWNEKDQQIQVAEGNGFMYSLKLRTKLDSTPSMIYDILTDPGGVNVFRGIKACTHRQVIEEDKAKKQRKLEVGHRALARFLFISITFETRLFVWEDDIARKIRFCNAREGFMKKFEGSWHIQPFNQHSIHGPSSGPLPALRLPNPLAALQTRLNQQMGGRAPAEPAFTLVTLEQAILPRSPAPPGIKGLIRRLCAKQLKDMVEDLRLEVDKREGHVAMKKGKGGSALPLVKKPAAMQGAAAAASMSMSWPSDIWEHAAPINITIQL